MIPVLLMLAYPPGYPRAGSIQAARLRASDADRDLAVDILCAAVGDGRLTLAELEERVGAALSARTRAELAALLADLPSRPSRPSRPPAQSVEPADGAGERSRSGQRSRSRERRRPGDSAAGPATPPPSRWSLIQSLVDTWASPGPPCSPATVG